MFEPLYIPGLISYSSWPTLTKASAMIELAWPYIHSCDRGMEDELSLLPEKRGEKKHVGE